MANARVDSSGNPVPAMRKARAGLLAGIAKSRKKAPGFAKQCKRKATKRIPLAAKALLGGKGATATSAQTKLYMWGYDYYGRLGQGQHLGPKDSLNPESCRQCEVCLYAFACRHICSTPGPQLTTFTYPCMHPDNRARTY